MANRKKILVVFGTRPEAIKMAPLVIKLKEQSENFDTKVCVTAQHREMLDQVLSLFKIVPDFDLNIMKSGQDLYDVTSRVLLGMREVIKESSPDIVLVHGDTTTSTSAALAAFYQQVPVGHVEAGLRTNNIYSPWPEEVNRQLTGRITTFHFAPTKLSKKNLLSENINKCKIHITGNTVIDALYIVLNKIDSDKRLKQDLSQKLQDFGYDISKRTDRKRVLITGHRRENFGEGFINICKAIKTLSQKYQEVDFIYPMHLNPNVRNSIKSVFGTIQENRVKNIFFIEPLDYLPFVFLMSNSALVLTDSGGIQEEAPGLGKPVIVMRDTTERPEAVEAGTVKLVGTNYDKIIEQVSLLIEDAAYYSSMAKANNPYGDGKACERIIEVLLNE